MKNHPQHTTSVKIDETLWEDFRICSVRMKFSFQKLSERVLYLYNTDSAFRSMIHNTDINSLKEKK